MADTICILCNDNVNVFALMILPIQFWTAPWLSSALNIDSRTLLLTRPSSKLQYACMVIIFSLLLRYTAKLEWKKGILPILLSGFCCGIVHHAALFTFGMRGYSNVSSLAITLLTEWPALITGIAVVKLLAWDALSFFLVPVPKEFDTDKLYSNCTDQRYNPPSRTGTKIFTTAMWLGLITLLYPHLVAIDDKDAMAYLIPVISGEKMQTVGTAFIRARTCLIPRYSTLCILIIYRNIIYTLNMTVSKVFPCSKIRLLGK